MNVTSFIGGDTQTLLADKNLTFMHSQGMEMQILSINCYLGQNACKKWANYCKPSHSFNFCKTFYKYLPALATIDMVGDNWECKV